MRYNVSVVMHILILFAEQKRIVDKLSIDVITECELYLDVVIGFSSSSSAFAYRSSYVVVVRLFIKIICLIKYTNTLSWIKFKVSCLILKQPKLHSFINILFTYVSHLLPAFHSYLSMLFRGWIDMRYS
jgi:hypothetical protein